MSILVGCEFSGRVRNEFLKRDHVEAKSLNLQGDSRSYVKSMGIRLQKGLECVKMQKCG